MSRRFLTPAQLTEIVFNKTTNANPSSGSLMWDSSRGGLKFGLDFDGAQNVDVQLGQQTVTLCHNMSGATIPAGKVVYIDSVIHTHPKIELARADVEVQAERVVGVTMHSSANDSHLFVCYDGIIEGIDTSGFVPGDEMWLSPTVAGGLTAVRPDSPYHATMIGFCLKTGITDGMMLVRLRGGGEIADIHDVVLNGLTNGDILMYNSTTGYWENEALATISGAPTVSETPPLSPTSGMLWFDSITGLLYIYYDNSWVQVAATSGSGAGVSATYSSINFDMSTPDPVAEGRLTWNSGEGTLELGLAGGNVNLAIGQEEVVRVYNATASTLTDGQVVYISGAQGQRPAVALARADSEVTSAYVFGVVSEPILSGQEGFITTFGVVKGLNTAAFTEGAAIWLSDTTAGAFTQTKPVAPSHLVQIGFVVRAHATAGQIFVRNQNGYEIEELHDVLISGEQNNDALLYDSAVGVWKNNGTYLLNTSSTSQTKSGNLTISGTATANILDLNESQLTADVKNINVTTAFLIDSFSSSLYRSAEYILQFSQGTSYAMTKLMLIHDGTDVAISEYGHVQIGTTIPYDFNASYALGNLEITITCSTANIAPIDLKFTRTLFDA